VPQNQQFTVAPARASPSSLKLTKANQFHKASYVVDVATAIRRPYSSRNKRAAVPPKILRASSSEAAASTTACIALQP
jgi:hypothetical protein